MYHCPSYLIRNCRPTSFNSSVKDNFSTNLVAQKIKQKVPVRGLPRCFTFAESGFYGSFKKLVFEAQGLTLGDPNQAKCKLVKNNPYSGNMAKKMFFTPYM